MTDRDTLSVLELKLKKIAMLSQWYTDDKAIANSVTLSTKDTPNDGYLKTYVLGTMSGNTIGEIDIPKDFLVKSARTIFVETIDNVKKITKINNVQQSTPYDTAPTEVTSDGTWLDLIINVTSGTATDSHVCVNMDNIMTNYIPSSGITIDDNAIKVRIATNSGLEFDGLQLKVDVNTVTPNGLRIDTNSGLSLDLATWNKSTSAGTSGAMSADDKRQMIDNNNDLLNDTELASWFGYSSGDTETIALSGISDDPCPQSPGL